MEGAVLAVKLFFAMVFTVPPAVLLILGAVFSAGRGNSLLAAYGELTHQETVEDQKALGRSAGRFSFLLAACALLWPVGILTRLWLFWAGSGLFLVILLAAAVYLNRKYYFRK